MKIRIEPSFTGDLIAMLSILILGLMMIVGGTAFGLEICKYHRNCQLTTSVARN